MLKTNKICSSKDITQSIQKSEFPHMVKTKQTTSSTVDCRLNHTSLIPSFSESGIKMLKPHHTKKGRLPLLFGVMKSQT